MKLNAFTLSEVLITIVILGIIASITIPNLSSRYNEKVTVVKVKKMYSLLNDAFALATTENGQINTWDIGNYGEEDGAKKIFSIMGKYLQITQNYETNRGKIFSEKGYKTLNNNGSCSHPYAEGTYKIKLKDGSAIGFWSFGNEACKSSSRCGIIYLDINGTKAPNKIGADLFSFWLIGSNEKENSHVTIGYPYKNYCSFGTDPHCANGFGCTIWLINKGNMKYLREDVSADWTFKNNI